MAGDVGRYGNYLVAAIFFLVGLHFLDVIPMPWSGPGQVGTTRKGSGWPSSWLIFGIALGPGTFAFMAPMLGVSISSWPHEHALRRDAPRAYGLGHCS